MDLLERRKKRGLLVPSCKSRPWEGMCKSWMSVWCKSTGHVESSGKRLPYSANSRHQSLIIPSIRPSKVSENGVFACALMRAPCWRLQRYSLLLRAIHSQAIHIQAVCTMALSVHELVSKTSQWYH